MLVITGYQKSVKSKERKNCGSDNVHLLSGYAVFCSFQMHISHKRTSCFRKFQMLACCMYSPQNVNETIEKKVSMRPQVPVAKS